MITQDNAQALPAEWDLLAGDNYALQRSFLTILERTQPCGQRYHLFYTTDGKLDSIVLTFQTRMNLMQYTRFRWMENATLVHVPFSVTRPGQVIGAATRSEVEAFIRSIRGYRIVMNWRDEAGFAGLATGPMSPQLSLTLRWPDFDSYWRSLRSPYRRRAQLAMRKGKDLQFRILADNKKFNSRLYQLYRHVNFKSRIRIETLSQAYFQEIPARIVVCSWNGHDIGFLQLIENHQELVWAFVGYDPEFNQRFDVYHNMLLYMVRYAICQGFQVLEMGQTAEDAKLKLGARYTPLKILVGHSHPILDWCMRHMLPWLSYTPPAAKFHVFHD